MYKEYPLRGLWQLVGGLLRVQMYYVYAVINPYIRKDPLFSCFLYLAQFLPVLLKLFNIIEGLVMEVEI